MPAAIESGITYDDFFHMPLSAIKMQIHYFLEREKKEQELRGYYSWLNGYFTMYAIGSSISKKIKYPQNPLKEEIVIDNNMELTEEEKIKWQNKLFAKLGMMSSKHKKSKQLMKENNHGL